MRSIKVAAAIAATCTSLFAAQSGAAPQFVNGVVIPGKTLDATRQPGANRVRFGFFLDLYYDPEREEWWALSDRGPGGGVIDYATRVQRLEIKLDKTTGAIKKVDIEERYYAGSFVLGLQDSQDFLWNVAPTLSRLWGPNGMPAKPTIQVTFVPEAWEDAAELPADFALPFASIELEIPAGN